MVLLAHVTDTHLGASPSARRRNEQALAHLMAIEPLPDALLITGDVADHGTQEEYAASRAVWARWPGPLVVAPGNHDVREKFAEAWRDGPSSARLDAVLDVGDLRLLVLDSLVDAPPGQRTDHGELAPESLTWLEAELAADDRPTLVCLHHPPVTIGVELMDPIRLRDPEALAAVLERHAHVVAVLVGHAHTACVTTFAGRPLLVGGAVISTIPLDAEPLPRVWTDAPLTLALHDWSDGRLTTHWRSL